MAWHDALGADEMAVEEARGLVLGGVPIALFRLEDGFHALHDLCTHGHARLSEGYVEDACVECPLHQGLVHIPTGAARTAPISQPTRTYPTRVTGGRVEVEVADPSA